MLAQPLAQVVAPTRGRVAFAGEYRGYGRIVIIDHGNGWTTLLAHLDRLSVEVGSIVRQGDPIGTAGRDRPRVIVELRRNGRPVNIIPRSEEHTSELQSLMRNSYAVFCLKKKTET